MAHTVTVVENGELVAMILEDADIGRNLELIAQQGMTGAKIFADGIVKGVISLNSVTSLSLPQETFDQFVYDLTSAHQWHDKLVQEDELIALLDQLDWRHRFDVWVVRIALESMLYWMDFEKYRDPRWQVLIRDMLDTWPAHRFEQLFYPMKFIYSSDSDGRRQFWRFFMQNLAASRSEESVASDFAAAVFNSGKYEDVFREFGITLIANLTPKMLARKLLTDNPDEAQALDVLKDAVVRAASNADKLRDLKRLLDCFEKEESQPNDDSRSQRARNAAGVFLGLEMRF